MRLLNLTPHTVVLCGQDGPITLPASSRPARVDERVEGCGAVSGVTLGRVDYGTPIDLPDPEPGTLLVVSSIVRLLCPDRQDLVSPADFVRDDSGRPIVARALVGGPWLQQWAWE